MNEPTSPTLLSLAVSAFKKLSSIARIGGIAILALLLLIPLSYVQDLQSERQERRDKAVGEITSTWGDSQQVLGPILMVPYRYTYKVKRTVVVQNQPVEREVEETASDMAYFLPDKLNIEGKVAPRRLYRGIYQAVVYDADLHVGGEFRVPDFAAFKIGKYEVQWDQAVLALPIRDLRGVSGGLKVKWQDSELTLLPGSQFTYYPQGVHADLPKLAESGAIPFEINLTLRGSVDLKLAPLGMENVTKLTSEWPDPGFQGAYLPQSRHVTTGGFDAEWRISYYGRNFPQQWRGEAHDGFKMENVTASYYGVAFVSAMDAYRSVERSTKYGLLFIALVFVTFFLCETLTARRVHAVQYALVGAALVLFYLTLLSLSEFVKFVFAYGGASIVSVLLISLYSVSVLQSRKLALALASGLSVVYGLLYFILQLQDYALLAGTAGLLFALGAVMYVTRHIDWYGERK